MCYPTIRAGRENNMPIHSMIALIWYIIRDYSVSTYPLKTVCMAAKDSLEKEGHTVILGKRGNITVNGIPYLIYRLPGWNRYDVRNTGI